MAVPLTMPVAVVAVVMPVIAVAVPTAVTFEAIVPVVSGMLPISAMPVVMVVRMWMLVVAMPAITLLHVSDLGALVT